jgi:glyoxylase-like metal-dependent hydrolase (beta-lactamase superfamily II)
MRKAQSFWNLPRLQHIIEWTFPWYRPRQRRASVLRYRLRQQRRPSVVFGGHVVWNGVRERGLNTYLYRRFRRPKRARRVFNPTL